METILQFVIFLGLLLFFHELGHFIMARIFKIDVEEFGFGFPPRLVKLFTWQGTLFSLNWIPFGAFVRMKGETDPGVSGGMSSASPWVRLGILLGGPLMNVLVGIILFITMFMRIGAPNPDVIQIMYVNPGSPAEQAGLQPGDVLIQVKDQEVTTTEGVASVIQENVGQEIPLTIERDGVVQDVQVSLRANPPEGQGPLGITMGNRYEPVSLIQAIPAASITAYEQARQFLLMPVRLITGQADTGEGRLVGPKGMFDIYQEVASPTAEASTSPIDQPAVRILYFVGSISVALGLTNLLPIPALDGGRIIFLIPELILRKRVPARYENLVHLVGFAALLLLMGYITFQDFANPIVRP